MNFAEVTRSTQSNRGGSWLKFRDRRVAWNRLQPVSVIEIRNHVDPANSNMSLLFEPRLLRLWGQRWSRTPRRWDAIGYQFVVNSTVINQAELADGITEFELKENHVFQRYPTKKMVPLSTLKDHLPVSVKNYQILGISRFFWKARRSVITSE